MPGSFIKAPGVAVQVDVMLPRAKYPVMLAPVPKEKGEAGAEGGCLQASLLHNRRWRQLFISLGYDEQLRFSWHPYVLSVHASRTVTLRSFPARANQSEAVQVEQVISQGTAQRVGV